MLLGGLAPFAVPQFDVLLLSLVMLAAALVCLGLVASLQAVNRAVFGGLGQLLGSIPGIGGVLASPVNAVYHWMDHELGSVVVFLDARVGHYLHTLGQLFAWIGNEIAELATQLFITAQTLTSYAPVWLLHGAETRLRHAVQAAAATAEAEATRLFGLARHGIDALARETAGGLDRLEQAVEATIARDVASLRARARSLARDYETLFHRIRRLDRLLGIAGAVALVDVALTHLGLSWIKCRNWKRAGRAVCGMPTNLLSDLLGLVADFFVLTNVCTVIPWLEAGFSTVAAPLVPILTAAEAGLCAPGSELPPRLDVPAPQPVPLLSGIVLVEGGAGYQASGTPDRLILAPGPTL